MYQYFFQHIYKFSIVTRAIVKVAEMAVSVLVATVFLLSVSEVSSECPPSSGKTLKVYNNNCINFYRYLPDA